MADIIGVSESTFNKWKHDHPKFSESLKEGRVFADANVASRLYDKAMGYEEVERSESVVDGELVELTTRKKYPPDTRAIEFWLKNRRALSWRDKQEHEHTGKDGGPIVTKQLVVEGVKNEP